MSTNMKVGHGLSHPHGPVSRRCVTTTPAKSRPRSLAEAATYNSTKLLHFDLVPKKGESIVRPTDQDYLTDLGGFYDAADPFEEYHTSTQLAELESMSQKLYSSLQELGDAEPLVRQRLRAESIEATELRIQRRAAAQEGRRSSVARPLPDSTTDSDPVTTYTTAAGTAAADKVAAEATYGGNATPSTSGPSSLDSLISGLEESKHGLDSMLDFSLDLLISRLQHSRDRLDRIIAMADAPLSTSAKSVFQERVFQERAAHGRDATSTSGLQQPSSTMWGLSSTQGPPQYHASQSAWGPSPTAIPKGVDISPRQGFEPSAWAKRKHASRANRLPDRSAATSTSSSHNSKAATKGRARKAELLTAKEELELTRLVQDILMLERVKAEIRSILKREPALQEWARAVNMDPDLFLARLRAGEQSRSLMMHMNRALVYKVSNTYKGLIPQADLFQVGMEGLFRGVERFDGSKGFRFGTYAHWWVRQSFTRAISNQSRSIRLPNNIYAELVRIKTFYSKHCKEHGAAPTTQQTGDAVGMSQKKVEMVLAAGKDTVSLDRPLGDGSEEGNTLLDTIQDESEDAWAAVDQELMKSEVAELLKDLNERDATVIRHRFGLDGLPVGTYESVGQLLGLSRERVRQIQAASVRKLRNSQDARRVESMHDHLRTEVEMVPRNSRGTRKS